MNVFICKSHILFGKINIRGTKVMKKVTKFLSTVLFSLGAIASLASCGKNKDTDYNKVKKAFNGVESSFKEKKKDAKKRGNPIYFGVDEGPSSSLQAIENLFSTSSESRGDTIDELEYDQPPMIQFQCLKTVFDSIGDSFQFSNKYYDTINGTAYLDISNGEPKSASDGQEYQYAYNFTLGLGVKFEDGLISADVSFDIVLTRGENHYNASWFVKMYLDYDFDNSNPTYTLLMLSDVEENDFAYRIGTTYEYDFVKVNKSKITEWRKFYLEVDQKLVKDGSHQSFDSYKDSVTYKTGNLSWYKDHNLLKVKNISDTNNLAYAKELFALGLNSSDISKESYFNEQGTQTSKISDMYRSFSNIFGKDLVYALITSESKSSHSSEPASLRFVFNTTGGGFDNVRCSNDDHDITFRDLFTEGSKAWNEEFYPVIYYMDENGVELEAESDLSKFKSFVRYGDEQFEPNMDDRVDVIFKGVDVQSNDYQFTLTLALRSNEQVRGTLNLIFCYTDKTPDPVDDVIASIGIEGDEEVLTQGGFWPLDDICVKDFFISNTTHRQYIDRTAEFKTVSNFNLVYRNSKGQKLSDIPLTDISFGFKDSATDEGEYMFDPTYATTNISELWYQINSKMINDRNYISVRAQVNNKELDKDKAIYDFAIIIKHNIADVPIADAIKNAWPTRPIEVAGFRYDLPVPTQSQYVGESLWIWDDMFMGNILSLDVRLTDSEYESYLASAVNSYGYRDNGSVKDPACREFIKNERRLTIGVAEGYQTDDVYSVHLYTQEGIVVPDVNFDGYEFPYIGDPGYQIGVDIRAHGPGISEESHEKDDVMVTYYFENGNQANNQYIKNPGTYKISVEVRYGSSDNYRIYFDRRITATFTILPE